MNLRNFRVKSKELLAKNRIDLAIQFLKQRVLEDSDKYAALIVLESYYNSNIEDYIAGLMNDSEKRTVSKEIVTKLVNVVDVIGIVDLKNKYHERSPATYVNLAKRKKDYESDRFFDASLREALLSFGKNVELLTKDQFRIIKFLINQNRGVISGCAGSGKTLVAVEQSIRLAAAGNKTLLLCHSIVLAKYLRSITRGSSVVVLSFMNLVHFIREHEQVDYEYWSHHLEPTDIMLDEAISKLEERNLLFDAIIVDEGQDFREEWWLLIEYLLGGRDSKLFIFCDDNQMLLPYGSCYPIDKSPYDLSRNVRNGGRVFSLMTRFHRSAPDLDIGLVYDGEVLLHPVNRREKALRKIKWLISKRLQEVDMNRITIIISNSDTVNGFISEIKDTYGPKGVPSNYDFIPFGTSSRHSIAIHSIDTFKGMESDLIILFVNKEDFLSDNQLYVAVSRARLYLDIVANLDVVDYLRAWDESIKVAGASFANRYS